MSTAPVKQDAAKAAKSAPVSKAARNLANVLVVEPRYADPLSLVHYKKVLVTKSAMEQLKEMLG